MYFFTLIYLPFIGNYLLGKGADVTLNNRLDTAPKGTFLSPVSAAWPLLIAAILRKEFSKLSVAPGD